jgi:hypothetical protein
MNWYWTTNENGLTNLTHIPVRYWTNATMVDSNPWTFRATKMEETSSNQTWILANTRVVVVLQDDIPPQAVASDITVELGVEVTLDGWGSTDNGVIVSWLWTFDDGIGTVQLEGIVVNWTFPRLGTFNGTLNISDGVGLTDEVGFNITVVDTTAPMVVAGENLTVPQRTSVDLNGTGTQDNDPTLIVTGRFVWRIFDTVEGDLKGATEGIFESWRFDDMGTFRVMLEVWDQSDNYGASTFWVTVLDSDAPTVDTGPDLTVNQYQRIQFRLGNVADNDPTFDDTGLLWWIVEWMGVEENHTGLNPWVSYDNMGRYNATLYAMDASGNLGSNRLSITVLDSTPPSVRVSENLTVQVGSAVTLSDEGTTDNDPTFPDGAAFRWAVEGPGLDLDRSGSSITFTVPQVGEYTATLTVTDAGGKRGAATLTIVSVDTEVPTVLSFEPGPEELLDSGLVTVRATLRDEGVGIMNSSVKWRWRGTDSEEWSEWFVVAVPNRQRQVDLEVIIELPEGEAVIQLAAQDMEGNPLDDGEGHLIRINSRPIAVILSPVNGADYGPYDSVLLDASGSHDIDPGDPLSYFWDSDVDGFMGSGARFRATLSAGNHMITLRVSDGIDGHDVVVSVNVTVRPVPSTVGVDEFPWIWIVVLAMAIVVLGGALWNVRRQETPPSTSPTDPTSAEPEEPVDKDEWELMEDDG